MQKDILDKHPDSDLKVYVVWFDMLAADSRSRWDQCAVSDPRATNLWDKDRVASRTLGPAVEGASPPVWDAYLLYGPDAKWADGPPSPVGTGSTIYGTRQQLEKDILPFLGNND
ncbi:MAG: hypothetical protein H0U55_15585 [Rubrobacteraceae bacterium]|nr:hypothetical protein [Rubrobacteraceae bacterium]